MGRSSKRAGGDSEKRKPAKRRAASPAESQAAEERSEQDVPFPIVGIGASAGGLEALELFLKNVPERSGMAYVVIQHLDPTRKGMIVELLQRASKMPLVQVKDRQRVAPDHVYVIPPGENLSVLHGRLHLLPQAAPRGLNLPIDFFFRSLAEDQQDRSIGVVLSGMGSDGTLGLRAIREKAGVCFVQSLTSAKFDGMPRSAIEAGLADVVAPAEELPARIVAYRRHAPFKRAEAHLEERAQGALQKVFALLRVHTGNDFSLYKQSTIYRRIERRMGLHQLDKIANYVRYLQENPREIELLFHELLIGVTSFFRDPAAWERLAQEVLPQLLDNRTGMLRAWVPGCSTGEEAYSLAMVFKEAVERLKPARTVSLQVFATDLDREAIEVARQGVYPANIATDVSPERLRRFFVQDDRGFRVNKDIREMVVFAPQNIIMDPPFTKLDVLSCRNLLIYLSPELQKKLIPLFHYALNPGGVLFLGSAETVGGFTSLFGQLDGKTRVYRRLDGAAAPVDFPAAFALGTPALAREGESEVANAARVPPPNLQLLADRVLVQRFAPSAVLVNEKGDILYTSGRTGKFLEPTVGKANLNIFAMARDGLRFELSSAFARSQRDETPVIVRGVRVGANGGTIVVDITVQRLAEPKELRGTTMVILAEGPREPEVTTEKQKRSSTHVRLAAFERELQQAREEVQTTREEMQTSQEELKSTNEELQSTNEELQSTNEELTTSKEEMQSLNEELQTVNHELQAKVDELSRSNNDMKNLLNSTDIATLFLDGDLLVRRFTTPTSKIIKLIPGDAGRPITDIATELEYPELADDAREVLRTLMFKEKLVSASRDRWFSVRIMPYRTLENVIDGVVITFTDASAAKTVEAMLDSQASQLRQMAESLPHLMWGALPNGDCDYISPQWADYTGEPEAELLGHGWLGALHPEDRRRVQAEWRQAIDSRTPFNLEMRIRGRKNEYRWFRARAVPILDDKGHLVKWYGTNTDIDDLKQAADLRASATRELSAVLDQINDPIVSLDEGLKVVYLNDAAQRLIGRKREAVAGQPLRAILPDGAHGAAIETKARQALKERRAMTERLSFGRGADSRAFGVRIYPRETGLAIVFDPAPDGAPATAR
jgi:two-component system CheB/CheR fusion protein